MIYYRIGHPINGGVHMIVYYGSIRKFNHFEERKLEQQKLPNDIDTIGFWFTPHIHSAKPFAIGKETVMEKSTTEFWDDGEPKIVQYDKIVHGYVYKVYVDEPNIKNYDSYELFLEERDKYCDYVGKDHSILLNKEEANNALRQNLMKHHFEGFVIRNMKLDNDITDLYCIFSEEILQIADVMQVDSIH